MNKNSTNGRSDRESGGRNRSRQNILKRAMAWLLCTGLLVSELPGGAVSALAAGTPRCITSRMTGPSRSLRIPSSGPMKRGT